MKPRVIRIDGAWRVYYHDRGYFVAVYATWERALRYANQIAQKANQA